MESKKSKIVIRPPRLSDTKSLNEMINSLVDEKAMILVQEKLTFKQEKEYVKKIMKDKESIHLFLVIDGKIMGSATLSRQKSIKKHIGGIGIVLRKEARGLGLGEKLFKETMEKGIKKFKLKIITLDVFKKNNTAYSLYNKLGFEKVGIIKNGAKYYNEYQDIIIMVKYIK